MRHPSRRKKREPARPDRSPLTSELLALGEELTEVLDYEDIEAVAHIPKADAWADVEMQESNSPPGFEPEVSRSRYDVNLVRMEPAGLGSASPVMASEDKILDEEIQSRAPGAGRLGNNDNPSCTDDN